MMHEPGKSDRPIVPAKPANTGGVKPLMVEWEERRGLAKEKAEPAPRADRTQCRVGSDPEGLHQALERIRQAARRDKGLKFTSLWHHVYNVDRLREAYLGLAPHAAPGEDRVTWQQYGRELEANLRALSRRLANGVYRAKPVKRVYIPKADGRQRPIGIPALEDKIVQRATVAVLNAVYETDFLGFSYGFRPGRGQHNALDALTIAKRLRAKLKEIKLELRRRMHEGIAAVGRWLSSVVRGHYQYYGVPGNDRRLRAFNYRVFLHWWAAICRRSQKGRISLERMTRIATRWLPRPRVYHPYPAERLCV